MNSSSGEFFCRNLLFFGKLFAVSIKSRGLCEKIRKTATFVKTAQMKWFLLVQFYALIRLLMQASYNSADE